MSKGQPLRFIPYTPKHADKINAIYTASIQNNTKGFIQDLNYHGPITDQAEALIDEGGQFSLALLDTEVVGFGALKKLEEGILELCKLHIAKPYLGKGYGLALSKHLILTAQELESEKIALHVTTSQTPAINLYKKLGFEETGQWVYVIKVNGIDTEFETLFMEKNLAWKPSALSVA